MDLTHSVDITGSSETYIHASKSTDFIKPKDSSNNLETHNQGNRRDKKLSLCVCVCVCLVGAAAGCFIVYHVLCVL